MSERAEFHVMGQPLDGEPLHYTASGLDYVYLVNGFSIEEDPDYGRIVTVDAPDDLHRAIGLHIITKERPLTGAEFRFLRKQMKLTQAQLAERFRGANVQTIANYEKGRKIPPASEQLMRMIFLLWLIPPDTRAAVVKEINDQIQRAKPMRRKRSSVIEHPSYPEIAHQWKPSEGRCALN